MRSSVLTVAMVAAISVIVFASVSSAAGPSADLQKDRPCDLVCPPGAQLEGEPPCVDGYLDGYNGGCGGGSGFTPIEPQVWGSAVVCGRSCTHVGQEWDEERDTDWYWVNAAGGWLTMRATGEFDLQAYLIYGTECYNLQYAYDTAPECETAETAWYCPPDQMVWLMVTSVAHTGLPESDYHLEVSGIHSTGLSWGACCDPQTGECTVVQQQDCDGYWPGPWWDCSPSPCAGAGSCCLADGSCVVNHFADCAALGGEWNGPYTDCSPSPCPHACCLGNGACRVVTEAECQSLNGTWMPDQITCTGSTCLGACCLPTGACEVTSGPDGCQGNWVAFGIPCEPDPCGSFWGACCLAAGGCELTADAESCEGLWLALGTPCDPDPCDLVFGACCFADGTCEIRTIASCTADGGTWIGWGVNCVPGVTCPPPTPVENTSWGRIKQRFR